MIGICNMLCLAIIVVTFTSAMANQYCDIPSCTEHNFTHTMCKFPTSSRKVPAPKCGGQTQEGLTTGEKELIVRKHNELRRKVASGEEHRGTPGPQPPATSMPDLTWDDELEIVSQRWADQCNLRKGGTEKDAHDECRHVERFKVGQNVALSWSTGNDLHNVEEIVQDWYDEVEMFDNANVKKFDPFNFEQVGHYTQLVWGTTTKIGCGCSRYEEGLNYFLLVCNYGPGGNVNGKMYE